MEGINKDHLIGLLKAFCLQIYFGSIIKKRKEYIHKCEKCGEETMYRHKPNPICYPPHFYCLSDKCLWEMYNDPEISDLKNLI